MTWTHLLNRVLNIAMEAYPACGGAVRIIVCIEGPGVIEEILTYLDAKGASADGSRRPPCRAPPPAGLFD